MDLVGEAASGDEAILAVDRLHPDIVLMDIRMPTVDGISATREIKATYPNVKVIGLSDYTEGCSAMEKAGALGVCPKSRATEKLHAAIKKSQLDPAI
jgi:DNA-binding NarL/FixJ family response regulator